MIDLHTHSTCSDGVHPPAEVVRLAAEAGLAGIALTDHDTRAGWDEAARACAARGLTFVPGIELSCEHRDYSVHLLGYWVDPDDPALVAECARLRVERDVRARRILDRLAQLGVKLAWADVAARAGDAPVGRPHIAAALVARGAVADHAEAFDRYLCDGGPAWVPKHALDPIAGVRLLHGAGGVAVLAHPGLPERGRDGSIDLTLVDRLTAAGLRGIETDHPGHDPDVAAWWREVAMERELLATGASDFHGIDPDAVFGQWGTTASIVESLAEHANLV